MVLLCLVTVDVQAEILMRDTGMLVASKRVFELDEAFVLIILVVV